MYSFKFVIPLSIVMILSACDSKISETEKQTSEKIDNPIKAVKEIRYMDGGATVLNPTIRTVSINVKDSANLDLTYMETNGIDTTRSFVKIPKDQIETLYDNMLKMIEIPDGMEIIPGKVPCVGRKGIEVSIIFNTGDTSRFEINGGALCDKDVIPEWKKIDSIATLLHRQYKASF